MSRFAPTVPCRIGIDGQRDPLISFPAKDVPGASFIGSSAGKGSMRALEAS